MAGFPARLLTPKASASPNDAALAAPDFSHALQGTDSKTPLQSTQPAEPIIFKIPRAITGIIARFSVRFAMDKREGHIMRCATTRSKFRHESIVSLALTPVLPLSAELLNFGKGRVARGLTRNRAAVCTYLQNTHQPDHLILNSFQKTFADLALDVTPYK